ncbi:Frataxin [Lactarius hatsudake]|nr:Frataxin [Lactarius hatsudake]KAH9006010.1 Frataxin [Lactarius hatsudake]
MFLVLRHPRLLPAFSKAHVAIKGLSHITLPVATHRNAQTRLLTLPAPQVAQSSLQQSLYEKLADTTMEGLLDELQNILDSQGDPSLEVEYHSGVLTLDLGQHGTYVINKQPPNKQIWLSSPVSGPKRFNFDATAQQWVDSRNGQSLEALLNEELTTPLGIECGIDLKTNDL